MTNREQNIFRAICKSQDVVADDVLANIKCRKREYVFVRQLFIYFLFYHCGYTKRRAARTFEQEHDYTIYIIKTMEGLYETSKEYEDRINKAMEAAKKEVL